ncbi:hypothetical protein IFR05_016495 [Cadophora sp. M221]|nr:hypothetical protein IFR05_016495 [Cadophora sp. M221]
MLPGARMPGRVHAKYFLPSTMVRKLAVVAILASIAMAAPLTEPVQRRTFPLSSFGGLWGGKSNTSGSISASAGFSIGVASALEACSGGATSGSVDSSYRIELATWIQGSGSAYFDAVTRTKIGLWCTTTPTFALDVWTKAGIEASLLAEPSVAIAGGVMAYFNAYIEKSFEGGSCACSAMSSDDQLAISDFLSSSGASLEAGISGSLHTSAAGGFAESLSVEARGSLSAWISSPRCSLSVGLKGSVSVWLEGGVGGSVGGGIVGGIGGGTGGSIGGGVSVHGGGNVVIYGSAQTSLSAFIEGSAFGSLEVEVQGGLHACVAGGVSSSISSSVHASLSGWLLSPKCPFDLTLRAACEAWLSGTVSTYTKAGTSADAYGYVAGGAKISGSFDASGALTGSAQGSFSAFISGSGITGIDAGIMASLKWCASGKLASSLDASAAALFSAWLSSSSCPLSVELRGTAILWLSFGINGSGSAQAGVGAGAGAGFSFSGLASDKISGAISGSTRLSSTCKGAIGIALGGETAFTVSASARAEVGAFLLSTEGQSIGFEAQAELIGWLSGCGSSKHGSYPVSSPKPISTPKPATTSKHTTKSKPTTSPESTTTPEPASSFPTFPTGSPISSSKPVLSSKPISSPEPTTTPVPTLGFPTIPTGIPISNTKPVSSSKPVSSLKPTFICPSPTNPTNSPKATSTTKTADGSGSYPTNPAERSNGNTYPTY